MFFLGGYFVSSLFGHLNLKKPKEPTKPLKTFKNPKT